MNRHPRTDTGPAHAIDLPMAFYDGATNPADGRLAEKPFQLDGALTNADLLDVCGKDGVEIVVTRLSTSRATRTAAPARCSR